MKTLESACIALFSCGLLVMNFVSGAEVSGSQDRSIENHVSTDVGQFNHEVCFEKVWTIIDREFWDRNFNGVDWDKARHSYRPDALAAPNHEAFAVVVNDMLGELKTSHTRYFTKWEPEYYTLQAALISGDLKTCETSPEASTLEELLPKFYTSQDEPRRTSIGIVTKRLNDRHYVSAVLAASPAKRAGIVLGDWIVEVDGKPFHPIRSFADKQGRAVELTIQRTASPSSRRTLKVTPVNKNERRMFEDDAISHLKETMSYKRHHFSYIRLWWLMGWKMRGVFETAIGHDDAEGIIVDIRDGYGGSPPTEYTHPFLQNGLETVTTEVITRNHTVRSKAAYNKPVIVLINGGSRSGKELLAYYFKKTKRGLLMGERTAGFVAGGSYQRISDESILLYCKAMIVVDGKRLEGVGVEPDIEVPFDIRFAAGRDVQLERAMEEMARLIEDRNHQCVD